MKSTKEQTLGVLDYTHMRLLCIHMHRVHALTANRLLIAVFAFECSL